MISFATLPPPQDVHPTPLVLGSWVWATPLWGNPFLLSHEGCVLEVTFPIVACHTSLPLVATLVSACRGAQYVLDQNIGHLPHILRRGKRDWILQINAGMLGSSPPADSILRSFPDGPHLVLSVFSNLPHAWQVYCTTHYLPAVAPLTGEVMVAQSILMNRLGWAQPGGGSFWLLTLTVRQATYLATKPSRDYRATHHRAFHYDAFPSPPPPEFRHTLNDFPKTLSRLWHIRWENSQKEAFWRLAIDGFTMFGNTHNRWREVDRCQCVPPDTPPYSPRNHHFWDCSIARSLIRVLNSNLRLPPDSQLSRHQLWLALPPETCTGRVWDVVCLAAISALRDGWVLISVNVEGRPRCPIPVAEAKVLASFWSRLSSFASMGPKALASWRGIPSTHPFPAWRNDALTVHSI